jgi:hypothetical protein
MSAINDLYKKEKLNNVEELIARVSNYAWEEMTLQEQGELRERAAAELAALLAAGNAIAERLRNQQKFRDELELHGKKKILLIPRVDWESDAAALEAWEQVTK